MDCSSMGDTNYIEKAVHDSIWSTEHIVMEILQMIMFWMIVMNITHFRLAMSRKRKTMCRAG